LNVEVDGGKRPDSMPLKRMLNESGGFDPNAVAILLEAYDGVVAELGLKAPEERLRVAKLIVDLARNQTDIDAALLRNEASNVLLREGLR
jgi:hypothetical protein